jgi:hypothetical protein
MASQTSITGEQSQLIASAALLNNGYSVSRPLVEESHDLVIEDRETGLFLKGQVKTILLRTDKKHPYYVVFSRKGNGKSYTKEEADVIIGVYNDEVYMIDNTKQQQEYWSKPHEAETKWKKLKPFK